ncbi:MAG TPA: hypothetical protein PLO61_00765 [Fimbriimonadaceae bacterium]|nr:hypothetical protein [Fimbriimonadaceae bacterium]HRJ32430.1 hypothetical protein [Fimbriimonadaceae bacterium]
MKIRIGLLMGCSFLSAAMAFAQRPAPQRLGPGSLIEPIRAAQVDANGNLLGPWIDLQNLPSSDVPVTRVAYDNVEVNPNTFPGTISNTLYALAPPGFLPGERIFFGPTYPIPTMTNDFQLLENSTWGKPVGRAILAFYVNQAANPTTRLLARVRIADNYLFVLDSGTQLPYSGASTSIVLDFGTVPTGGTSYRVADVDLFAAGLNLTLPADGAGAVEVRFFSDVALTQPANVQMMNWATRSPINTGLNSIGTNPSNTGATQWDSDNPADFTYVAAELYNYLLGYDRCDPIGACVAFLVQQSATVTGTLNFGQLAPAFYSGPLPSSLPVSFRNAANVEVGTGIATLNPVTGAFSVTTPDNPALNTGFRVSFKLDPWLRKTLPDPLSPAQPVANWNFGQVNLITGDIDGDNEVTNADYSIWAFDNGNFVPPGTGSDIDGDGEVTNADYSIWAFNNGTLGDD